MFFMQTIEINQVYGIAESAQSSLSIFAPKLSS